MMKSIFTKKFLRDKILPKEDIYETLEITPLFCVTNGGFVKIIKTSLQPFNFVFRTNFDSENDCVYYFTILKAEDKKTEKDGYVLRTLVGQRGAEKEASLFFCFNHLDEAVKGIDKVTACFTRNETYIYHFENKVKKYEEIIREIETWTKELSIESKTKN